MIDNVARLHEAGLYKAELSYEHVDRLAFAVVTKEGRARLLVPNTGASFPTNVRTADTSARNTRGAIVPLDKIIPPDESEALVRKLAAFPEVKAYKVGHSYRGRDISIMNIYPNDAPLIIRAKPVKTGAVTAATPGAAPQTQVPPAAADAPPREQPMNQIRVTERAFQDREIVYFLKDPETHAFSLYHDYTAQREGEHQYVNVVRTGSAVSDPSARILDTGEALKTRTLTGADIAREKIDIPDRVEPDTQVVLIPFTPVKKGASVRLRIAETYTDPARYALVEGQLMWHRSFGRPRNDMVLPAGWYLTTTSIPAVITQEADGRVRLSFWNPRPDNVDVFVKGRRR